MKNRVKDMIGYGKLQKNDKETLKQSKAKNKKFVSQKKLWQRPIQRKQSKVKGMKYVD